MDLITPDFGIIFWQTVTFVLVLFILRIFAWKPILGIIKEREQAIEKDLESAASARKIVNDLHVQQKQLLEKAHIKRDQIIKEAETAKNSILEEAALEAKQLSERILGQARLVIEEEKTAAFEKLKNEVVVLSVQIAEKLIAKELETNNKQEELVYRLMKKASFN